MGISIFQVERFNTGVYADMGIRTAMEDTNLIIQDFKLDEIMKFSLYAVIDGHGGDWCAHFIRKRFESEFRKQLNDPVMGFRRFTQGNINECISQVL